MADSAGSAADDLSQVKTCKQCGSTKPLAEFYPHKTSAGGRLAKCKECVKSATAAFHDRHRETILAKRRSDPKEAQRNREYREQHPDQVKAWRRASAARTSEKNVIRVAEWRKRNPDRRRAVARAEAARRRSTPRGRLDAAMASAIYASLKAAKAGAAWSTLVGYSTEQLMAHLEERFLPGMTWANYGKWHVDHVIPKSAFIYQSPTDGDFARCWALSNLQPLWARDNLVKGAKY